MAADWRALGLSEFVARRSAMLGLVEDSLPDLLHAPGKRVRPVLDAASRIELDPVQKIRLWKLVWRCDPPARWREGDAVRTIEAVEALVLSGPSATARVGRPPASGKEDASGDDVDGFMKSFGHVRRDAGPDKGKLMVGAIDLDATIAEAAGEESAADTLRVGIDTPWRRSLHAPAFTRTFQYDADFRDPEAEEAWTPASLPTDAETEVMVRALVGGSASDPEEVRARARADFELRRSSEPWRSLFSPGVPATPEAQSFFARAEEDLMGFERPRSDDAGADATVTVHARVLPFYENTDLIDMVDRRGGYPRTARFMAEYAAGEPGGDAGKAYARITPIDWKSDTIHRKNAGGTIRIDRTTVSAYLNFFCQYIHADDGYFRIVEDEHELNWIGVRTAARKRAAALIRPIEIWTPEAVAVETEGKAATQCFLARSQVIYGRALFSAAFVVDVGGNVGMLDDTPHVSRLPIVPEKITAKTHFIYLRQAEVD